MASVVFRLYIFLSGSRFLIQLIRETIGEHGQGLIGRFA